MYEVLKADANRMRESTRSKSTQYTLAHLPSETAQRIYHQKPSFQTSLGMAPKSSVNLLRDLGIDKMKIVSL